MNPILIVEDDENDVFFLRQAIKKAGIDIALRVVSDGRKAIDYFEGKGEFANREAHPLPCLVLLDLKLPYVMGLDVLRRIRQFPDLGLVVIILSASRNEADIAEAYRRGANAYLVKPAEVAKLGAIFRSIKDFWLTFNTPPPQHGGFSRVLSVL
jgi:DNA-binding response OmpR family regulator